MAVSVIWNLSIAKERRPEEHEKREKERASVSLAETHTRADQTY